MEETRTAERSRAEPEAEPREGSDGIPGGPVLWPEEMEREPDPRRSRGAREESPPLEPPAALGNCAER
jgi:hypothetical protein